MLPVPLAYRQPSARSQEASPPPKGYCQCSPHVQRGQMSTKLIWGHEPASAQALWSIGVRGRGVTGDSEKQELVWGVKAASWRKWSWSGGDRQLEWGQECL